MRIGGHVRSWVWGTAAATAVLATACRKSAPPPMAFPPAAVTVVQPAQREVTDQDEFPGRVTAVEMVDVKARVNGYLQSINFKDGAEVKKGDLLFVIDARPYQMELDRANAAWQEAETHLEWTSNDLARAERMLTTKAISEEETESRRSARDGAVAAVAAAQAAIEIAKLNLDYTHITAPISGRIGQRMMTVGNLVNGNQGQSTLLATVVSLDPIYCYFDADEQFILKYERMARETNGQNLRNGKVACDLELANETNFPHHGVIDFVDNQVDAMTGTMSLRGVFSNADRTLQPGFFARVRVPSSIPYAALLIPDRAVETDQDKKFVLTVNAGNIAQYQGVTLGPMVDGLRVVRDGLKPQEWVVIEGLMAARPGATVNPTRTVLGAAPGAPPAAEKH